MPAAIIAPAASRPQPKWNYSITPRNGLMTWDASYAVKSVPVPPRFVVQQTHLQFGWQSAQRLTGAGLLPNQDAFGRPLNNGTAHAPFAVLPSPLQAVALPLPGTHAPPPYKPRDWNEWYQHVARAIYGGWARSSVGAASATVRVSVWPSRDIDCKIVDFAPAKDLARDAAAETRFRDTALAAVNALDGSEVWQFPDSVRPPKCIVFDMEFKREVGGDVGCKVVHMHTDEAVVK